MVLKYKPQAVKDIKKLSIPEKRKVIRKLQALAKDERSGKPLKGEFEGLWSIRAWPFRIIYEIRKKDIVVYTVKHRQSAYRKRS